MLHDLAPDTMPRLMRQCALTAVAVGTVGFIVAAFIAPVNAALGVAIGTVLALANLRQLSRQVTRLEVVDGATTKQVRRRLRTKTLSRLVTVTVLVILALWISIPLGMGIVSGLVLYQIVFVANVFRAVAAQGGLE